MTIAVILILLASLMAVLAFRAHAKRSSFGDRKRLPLEEIFELVRSEVSWTSFRSTWEQVGEAYGIDPRLLRPTDTFAQLAAIDSWRLDSGGDRVRRWLVDSGLRGREDFKTLLDVAIAIEAGSKGKGVPAK
jgi:hypothetical protein